MSEKIQAVLAANPNTSWNDLVFNRLATAVGTRDGALPDLWMRWFASQGYTTGGFSERQLAYWNANNVPASERNTFLLGWYAFFSFSGPVGNNGWFYNEPTASAHILTSGLI